MKLYQLYRHFDKSGTLLYVGRSISAICRLVSHRQSEWAHLITFVEIETFSSEEALAHAEIRAIRDESPLYNKVSYIHTQAEQTTEALPGAGSSPAVVKSHKSYPAFIKNIPDPLFLQPRRRGKPRIGEVRDKPWEQMGMSERTWHRRRAEIK